MFVYLISFLVVFIVGFVAGYFVEHYRLLNKTLSDIEISFTYSLKQLESYIKRIEGIKDTAVKNIESGATTDINNIEKSIPQDKGISPKPVTSADMAKPNTTANQNNAKNL